MTYKRMLCTAFALGGLLVGMGNANANFPSWDGMKWPSTVLVQEGEGTTILPQGQPKSLQESFSLLGLDVKRAYQVMYKVNNEYYYARVGEATIVESRPTWEFEALQQPVVIAGTAYAQLIEGTVAKAITEGQYLPLQVTLTTPVKVEPPTMLSKTQDTGMVDRWMSHISYDVPGISVTTPFLVDSRGRHKGTVMVNAIYGDVTYPEQLDLEIDSRDALKVRYVLTRKEDGALRNLLQPLVFGQPSKKK